jgi:succinylglutamate desuccinylase
LTMAALTTRAAPPFSRRRRHKAEKMGRMFGSRAINRDEKESQRVRERERVERQTKARARDDPRVYRRSNECPKLGEE